MLGQTVGFPVPEGGSGELTQALARRFESLGGVIRCGSEVTGIGLVDGRATRVRTAAGDTATAERAVVANTSAPALYERLLDEADVPARTRRAMSTFVLDPSTVKVDWALDSTIPWVDPPDVAPGTFHLSLIHISEPTRRLRGSRMPSSA